MIVVVGPQLLGVLYGGESTHLRKLRFAITNGASGCDCSVLEVGSDGAAAH